MSWDNNNIGAISDAYDRWYSRFPEWEDEDEEEEEEEEPLEQMWGESDEDYKHRCWQDDRYEIPDEEWDEYMAWLTAENRKRRTA